MSIDFFAANAPEDICLNVANGNADVCLSMLGIKEEDIDYCGEIPVDKLNDAWGALQNHKPMEFVREVVYFKNFINCGLPIERVARYFEVLDSLLVHCMKNQVPLNWG